MQTRRNQSGEFDPMVKGRRGGVSRWGENKKPMWFSERTTSATSHVVPQVLEALVVAVDRGQA
jgi:hypothetical protein